jgi:hypothetical protein
MEKNQTADHIFTLKSIIDSYKGPVILICRGGYGFLFSSEFFFRTTRELEYFFSSI